MFLHRMHRSITMTDYWNLYRERTKYFATNEFADAAIILSIKTRICYMLLAAYGVDLALLGGSIISGDKLDIRDGCYFLTYYLTNMGGYIEYDGEFASVQHPDGLEIYNKYVGQLLRVCESGTMKGNGFLVPFDEAKPFETCGLYRVNIRWMKGQSIEEAKQSSLGYSYLGH